MLQLFKNRLYLVLPPFPQFKNSKLEEGSNLIFLFPSPPSPSHFLRRWGERELSTKFSQLLSSPLLFSSSCDFSSITFHPLFYHHVSPNQTLLRIFSHRILMFSPNFIPSKVLSIQLCFFVPAFLFHLVFWSSSKFQNQIFSIVQIRRKANPCAGNFCFPKKNQVSTSLKYLCTVFIFGCGNENQILPFFESQNFILDISKLVFIVCG